MVIVVLWWSSTLAGPVNLVNGDYVDYVDMIANMTIQRSLALIVIFLSFKMLASLFVVACHLPFHAARL